MDNENSWLQPYSIFLVLFDQQWKKIHSDIKQKSKQPLNFVKQSYCLSSN